LLTNCIDRLYSSYESASVIELEFDGKYCRAVFVVYAQQHRCVATFMQHKCPSSTSEWADN